MATTPIYEHETWGRVVAVTHNGTRINRPEAGQTRWTPPRADAGTVTIDHPDNAEWQLTIALGVRSWPSMMLDNDDPRISPDWAALAANGTITVEMLAYVPQPTEQVLAAAKVSAKSTADAWLAAKQVHGISLAFAGGSRRMTCTADAATQLATYLNAMTEAGQSDLTLTDASGEPFAATLTEMGTLRTAFLTGSETLRTQWATARAAIAAATTTQEITDALALLA